MNCEVSVIIPTYNRYSLVQQAIDSVLNQTVAAHEIIVVDDGSTDGTGGVLQARYGDRVRYIWQENQGESVARNRGIALARGEYVALLDSDDLWQPEKLAKQVAVLEADPSAGMVFCLAWVIGQSGQRVSDEPLGTDIGDEDLSFARLIMQNGITAGGSTALIRRSVLQQVGGFDHDIRYGEDWDLWLRIANRFSIIRISEPLASVRRHRGTQCYYPSSERNALILADHLRLLDKAFASVSIQRLPARLRDHTRAHQYLLAGLAEYAVGDTGRAQEHWCAASSLSAKVFSQESGIGQLAVNHALAAAEGEGGFDVPQALEYMQRVFHDPQLADRPELRRKTTAQLHVALGFIEYRAHHVAGARKHLLEAISLDPTWARNRGVLSTLFESLFGPRPAHVMRRLVKGTGAHM